MWGRGERDIPIGMRTRTEVRLWKRWPFNLLSLEGNDVSSMRMPSLNELRTLECLGRTSQRALSCPCSRRHQSVLL